MKRAKTNGEAASRSPRLLCTLIFAVCMLVAGSTAHAAPNDRDVLVAGNTAFAFDLYKQLVKEKADTNVFFSPISISTALAMTYAGARGNTEKEMAQALRFDLTQKRLHPAYEQLLSGLKGNRSYQLAIANRLWGQKGYKFLPDFLKTAATNYQGGFQELDFIGSTEPSRETINAWIEEKTNKKITNLLVRGDITVATRLVLTNAIYFKGSWAAKFDPKQTREAPFYLLAGAAGKADMMMQKGRFNYLEQELFQLLELPYAGEKLSMIVLLPKKGVDFRKVEQMLSPDSLRRWRASMQEEDVVVFLPRFKTTMRFVINGELADLGMKDAFNEAADFSGMTGRRDLYISLVIHKAFVDVNEEGTEAAAATAVVMSTKSMQRDAMFRADRPFIFAILDKESGSVLFLGRLMNPRND